MADKDYTFRRISAAQPDHPIVDADLDLQISTHVASIPTQVQMLRGDAHGGFTNKRPDGSVYPIRTHAAADKAFPIRIRQELKIGEVFLVVGVDAKTKEIAHPEHGFYVRAVPHHSTIPDAIISWCEARIGTPYLKGGTGGPGGGDCSWETSGSYAYATHGKLILAHWSVAQYHDQRLQTETLNNVQRGDILAVEHRSDDVKPGHVAIVHEVFADGTYNVIDEEPGSLPGIPGGLHIRPATGDYWCAPPYVVRVMRVPRA